jgi:F-type H+-transporting ATPase subunit epsilon
MAHPSQLALEIVTPDRAIVHEQVDEVQAPGAAGYFGVLPGHTPMLAKLQVGTLWYRKGAEKTYLSVAGGAAEVTADRVIVLAEIAERAEEIDVDRAEASKQRAEQRLGLHQRDMDLERARVALMKAMTRLNVVSRARTRG